MTNIRFQEHQYTEAPIMALLASLTAIEAYMSVIVWSALRQIGIFHAIVAALFLVTAILLRRFTITVTDSELTFGFGPFKRRVRRLDVRHYHICECSLKSTGVGIHYVRGYWAWVARTGKAVQITLAPGGTLGYILSTSRPRDLIAAISTD